MRKIVGAGDAILAGERENGVLGDGLGDAGTDRAALRGLFDRLRQHVAQAEGRADVALGELSASLTQSEDPVRLRERAADVVAGQREAVRSVARLADEVGAMAQDLESRLARGDEHRVAGLRAIDRELRDAAARLDARLAEAEAEVDRAVEALAERLARWEAAAFEQDQRLSRDLVAQLDATEARRADEVARLLTAAERRPAGRVEAEPPVAGPEPRRRGSRSAALLLSAGVACLGLTTLAVLLEPPPSPGEPAVEAEAQIVMRGPILIAPPRFAEADELAPPVAGGAALPADAQKALAAAIGDVEAGRAGGLARLRGLADAGLPRAQMYLAKLYESGKGVGADSAEARRWTARAADAGDPVAMHNLALYYLQGRGGPRDDGMAARLLRRAASAGVADSQFNLGLLYETGAGVDRNLVEAYRWFQVAANAGDLKARERAVALEAKLSPREMASAERMAVNFRPGAELEEAVLVPGAATVAESQKKLARLGFYIGPTDGQDTPAYRAAVEAYRRSQSPSIASAGQP